jgi:hypothetical protein
VLDRPEQAQGVMALALEGEDRVHHVLEDPGAGQGAVLGHVADQDRGPPGLLGRPHQAVGALPHLGHRAGRRGQLGVEHRLDGVDDEHVGSDGRSVGEDGGQVGLGHQPQPGMEGAQPRRPHPHLLGRLLAARQQAPRAAISVPHGAAAGEGGQRL